MLKGIALSQLGPADLSSADLRAMVARGTQVIRIEATPKTDHGYLTYFHTHGGVKEVLLLGRAIIPGVWSKDLNSSGPISIKVQAAWRKALTAVLTAAAGDQVIDYVEVWNEPNSNITESGTGLHPAQYGAIFDTAYEVIKELSPQSRIITGGLFAHTSSSADYLRRVLPHSTYLAQADCIGWHPYLDIAGHLQVPHVTAYLAELHGVLGKRVFVTECGWTTTQATPAIQAANVASMIGTARASGLVEGCLIFTLNDAPQASPPLHYGIKDKPAWEAYRGA